MYRDRYGLTVSQLLKRAFLSVPDKEVLADGYRRLSYRELADEANWIASGLLQLGVTKGDRVAVCLPNWHEFVIIYFAVAKIGAILIPLNIRYRAHEIEYVLQNSAAKVAFFTREFNGINHYEQFIQAKKRAPHLQNLITVRFDSDHLHSFEQLREAGKNKTLTAAETPSKEDVFTILYTSGTTGQPKGAMLTHNNVVHTATITAESMRCTSDDVFLVVVPVFHVFGMVPSILSTVAAEARMVLMEQFKAESVLKVIQDERITVHHGVPTMFILELNHPSFRSYDLSSLRTGIIAAAPCPVEIVRRIRDEMGCDIVVAYGLSETSPTLTMTGFDDDDKVRAETVGKVLPGAEIKIVDDNRRLVPVGTVGELACRGFGVMKGYYNMPEMTREAIDGDGWFYTGDLATVDEQGYIRIVGRKKEMIIRGGYNIYPREIEEIFYTHPAVMEAAVVGLPDSVLGEISCACVRIKPGARATEEELREFMQSRVADYKVPDKIVFLEEFPMTASGKIRKVDLQNQLKEKMGGQLR